MNRCLLRLGQIGLAGLFVLTMLTAPLSAAPELAPAPVPPSMQPMPMPAPRDPQDAMPTPNPPPGQPPGNIEPTVKPGDKPLSIKPKVDAAKPAPSQDARGLPDLNQLFDRLRAAKSEDEAKLVNLMIEAEFLQSGSDTIDLLMYRALTSLQNQDMSLAMDLLDTIIALKPDYAEGWNKRATLYFMKRDYGKAISDVEMVLRLQPRHYPALIGLAQMLNELGDIKHALETLKRVQLIYPLNPAVNKQVEELQSTLGGRNL